MNTLGTKIGEICRGSMAAVLAIKVAKFAGLAAEQTREPPQLPLCDRYWLPLLFFLFLDLSIVLSFAGMKLR